MLRLSLTRGRNTGCYHYVSTPWQPPSSNWGAPLEASGASQTPPVPDYSPQPNAPSPQPAPRARKMRRRGVPAVLVVLLTLIGLLGGFVLGAAFGPALFAPGGGGSAATPGHSSASPIADVAATALPSTVFIQVSSDLGASTGTGLVFREDGYIVTNHHVIADAVDGGGVAVAFSDGQMLEAEIVGSTRDYDLAVLHVERHDLVPLPLANSDDVLVGDSVVAVGAPLGLDGTVTAGIVSALNRAVTAGFPGDISFINAIQTDAAINPGNSGGPLLNLNGEVIGINTAIAQPGGAASATGSIGLGFAIPSNQVARTSDQIIEVGYATYPVIGVYLDTSHRGPGALVADDNPDQPAVNPGGPADEAGIRSGDIILAIDGAPVTGSDEAIVVIRSNSPGDSITLTIERAGARTDVELILGESEAE